MSLQLIISVLYFIFLLPPPFSTALRAKPECPDRCGDLSIPYPFGVGSDCSLDPSFNITCNTSTDPPKAYLTIIDKEVIEINQSYVRVKYPNYLASACYNLSDVTALPNTYYSTVNLSGTQYTLSLGSLLTAVGCDDMVVGIERPTGSYVGGSCASVCTDRNDTGGVATCPDNGNWSMLGNGCCQTYISEGTTFLRAQLTDLSGTSLRRRYFPCSYAFIQEVEITNQSAFTYPMDILQDNSAFPNGVMPPVVRLDWRIGSKNCSQQLQNDPSYACRDRSSVCVDLAAGVGGYRCSCFQGYKGNPYLDGGCQEFSSSIAKPGCSDQCGNISIPFPFGVGPNCYMEPSFEISCYLHKAYLTVLNAEIIELNLSRMQIRVKYPNFALACYNLSDSQLRNNKTESLGMIIDLSATRFTLSTDNWLTAIGCDDMVVGYGGANRSFVTSSCASFCPVLNYPGTAYGYCPTNTDRYWPGGGCCQSPISKGTTYLEATLSDLSGEWRRRRLFSCSYAFIGEKSPNYIMYPLKYYLNSSEAISPFNDPSRIMNMVWSLALDWRIGMEDCNEARRNPATFLCRSNSDCVNFDANVGGYLCNCSQGYQGNPYLTPGCQDINECGDPTMNPCDSNSICINTLGSVICSCRKGYDGDGRKDGSGCSQLPPSKTKIIVLIGMSSGLGFLLLLLMCFWLYKVLQKRKEKNLKEKFFKRNGGLLLQQQTNEGTLGKTKVFPAKELEVATDNFNESRILGHGAQGTVYKGMLSDGKLVAIKKSKFVEENQVELFINEVVILSQINHRNVVKLLGCCLEIEVPLLVYEYMPNGTLFDLIHDPNNEFPVPWNMRLKMAIDIAGALAYLHSASSVPIYHRDIKSSNILLDEKYVVKISDFGTSRSVAADQTHLTTMVKGTFGYLDPEYFQSCQFTEKSDVYSFGVVLAELLTRQRPISLDQTDEERGLAMRFFTLMEDNCLDTILDPQILEQGRKEEVILVARLAQRCLNLKRKMRPTMKEVAAELESFRISQMSTTAKDESEEETAFEDMPNDIGY
ncbi:hypothetical protein C2S52_001876 [Perilla frutescens var. hirtella]|nr:hypothetical protein C2S52_001876 [Perilla frutescens var. hirtella]